MCCIFTLCGWVVDFIQRVWTFAMACCISSAICCSVVFAAMSGIALGYNYSLAEYIDLKETNVSVYLKRGVFDDEIADDKDWRRMSGLDEKPDVSNRFSTEEEAAMRVGRRMDDSILSDDQRKFEGFLMKLTAKPVYSEPPPPTSTYGTTLAEENWFSKFTKDQLQQLKAFQAEINREKAKVLNQMPIQDLAAMSTNNMDQQNLVHYPYPVPTTLSRRNMPGIPDVPPDSPRLAVPGQNIRDPYNWRRADVPNQGPLRGDDYLLPRIPSPIPLPGPPRPTRIKVSYLPTNTHENTHPTRVVSSTAKSVMDQLDDFKKNLIMEKYDKNMDPEDFLAKLKSGVNKIAGHDYNDDMDVSGLPVRKRRSIAIDTSDFFPSDNKTTVDITNNTLVQNDYYKNPLILGNITESNKVTDFVVYTSENAQSNQIKIDYFVNDVLIQNGNYINPTSLNIATENNKIADFTFEDLLENIENQSLEEESNVKVRQSIMNKTEVESTSLFQKFLNYFHVNNHFNNKKRK